ncbi:MAG: hypothetical protein M1830_010399 [Pleopsidium flavum]|nr:MAG: hypothetical protein M1830_010399 [Pleopsidium flavum]
MVKVALAGGTTGMGLSILNEILATNKHQVVLLSRSPKPELSAQGIDVRSVDYNSHDFLVRTLRGVHTVISAIASWDDSMRTSQLALVEAAKDAGVKRFAPSEYAGPSNDGIDLYAHKEAVWQAVKASGLEYTKFACGLFMNLFVTGTPRGEEEALSGLRPWNFIVNVKAGTADILGDGEAKATFTESRDVATFVAASLDLDKWDEISGMEGSTMSFNELVKLAEKVTERKFLIKHNSLTDLTEMINADPGKRFYNQVRLAIAEGKLIVKPTLNEKFPQVEPWHMEEWLEKWWGGVELGEPAWEVPNIIA